MPWIRSPADRPQQPGFLSCGDVFHSAGKSAATGQDLGLHHDRQSDLFSSQKDFIGCDGKNAFRDPDTETGKNIGRFLLIQFHNLCLPVKIRVPFYQIKPDLFQCLRIGDKLRFATFQHGGHVLGHHLKGLMHRPFGHADGMG